MCRHGLSTCAVCIQMVRSALLRLQGLFLKTKMYLLLPRPPQGGRLRRCGLRFAMAESSRGKLYLKLHQRHKDARARPATRQRTSAFLSQRFYLFLLYIYSIHTDMRVLLSLGCGEELWDPRGGVARLHAPTSSALACFYTLGDTGRRNTPAAAAAAAGMRQWPSLIARTPPSGGAREVKALPSTTTSCWKSAIRWNLYQWFSRWEVKPWNMYKKMGVSLIQTFHLMTFFFNWLSQSERPISAVEPGDIVPFWAAKVLAVLAEQLPNHLKLSGQIRPGVSVDSSLYYSHC